MAKEYYKKSTGLAPTNTPKIRIYESVDDALADLDNLEVGDVVASKLVEGAADGAEAQQIIADAVSEIDKVIPEDAGVTNMLVTQDELDEATGGITDKVDPTASSTNKLLSKNAIYQIMDAIEPLGTIKAVNCQYNQTPYDTEHWHICDGTNGTPNLAGAHLEGSGSGTNSHFTNNSISAGMFYMDGQNLKHSHDVNTMGGGGSIFGAYPPTAQWGGAIQTSEEGGAVNRPNSYSVTFIMKIANYAS
jgi:hypothetical protein